MMFEVQMGNMYVCTQRCELLIIVPKKSIVIVSHNLFRMYIH
jgi:hypothetical protein